MTLARILAALALLAPAVSFADTVDPFDISVYGTQSGGGALVTDYDFTQATVVSESLCAGGLCLYTSTDPGLISRTDGAGALQPLASGT